MHLTIFWKVGKFKLLPEVDVNITKSYNQISSLQELQVWPTYPEQ